MSVITKNSSARKFLSQIYKLLEVKLKTSVQILGASITNHEEIMNGTYLWYSITKWKGYKHINAHIKQGVYNWILLHPQVVQSPIENDFLKVSVDGHTKKYIPKMLLQVSIR